MRLRYSIAILCCIGANRVEVAAALAPEVAPIRIEIVASTDRAEPGKALEFGVLFHIDKPWHIYWRNPGESGLPTRISLRLPEGVFASEMIWPLPIEFRQVGGVIGYGYEGEAFFPFKLVLPKERVFGEGTAIGIDVQWLGCTETVCVPGKSAHEVAFPIVDRASVRSDLFATWRSRYPKDDIEMYVTPEVQGALSPGVASDFSVRLGWKGAVSRIEWFPLPPPALELTDIALNSQSASTLRFRALVLPGQALERTLLDSLLTFYTEGNVRVGVKLSIQLK